MLKFMKHQQKLSPERIQKQKELFSFSKACQHGFPTKPSSLSYDDELKLIALGTHSGSVTVYGAPGVEYYGQHESHDHSVESLCFVPGKGQVISLTSDNTLHQWQIQANSTQLKLVKSTTLEGKLKRVSVISCALGSNNLLVGTEGGNIYLCNLKTFTISDNIIYQDVVTQNVPDEFKVTPGSVECLCQHPLHPDRVLIGYHRGLCVLWDMPTLNAVQTYVGTQQLESLSWHSSGTKFISSHNDGSVTIWPTELPTTNQESVDKQPQPLDKPNTIYGPFPCKPITGVSWKESVGKESILVFSGGMQRASHGDRNTVTAMHYDGGSEAEDSSDQHVTFNLSSRVIDFVVIEEKTKESETDSKYVAGCLVILCEEEVVFIDLISPDWQCMPQPYLCSLHVSAITCTAYVSDPHPSVYSAITQAGNGTLKGLSTRPIPINGGTKNSKSLLTPSRDTCQDLLITGHEDGSVRVWAAGGVCVSLLHSVATASLFESDDPPMEDGAGGEDDDWPPFRKTGLFDPYSDDPRLAVKKVEMCGLSGYLVVAGTAGQVIVLHYNQQGGESSKLQAVPVNLVAENDSFVWKSHGKLELKQEELSLGNAVDVQMLIQLTPPASCTSLHLHSEWGLLACGTAHGFCLTDIIAKKNLLAKSTLSALDMANAADEGPMSRRKSLKKSLRESFRRLRRGRSNRKTTQVAATRPQPRSGINDEDSNVKVDGVGREVEKLNKSETIEGLVVGTKDVLSSSISYVEAKETPSAIARINSELSNIVNKDETAELVKKDTVESKTVETFESSVIEIVEPSLTVEEALVSSTKKKIETLPGLETDCIPYESTTVISTVKRTVESVNIEDYIVSLDKNGESDAKDSLTAFEPVLIQEIIKSKESTPGSVDEPLCIVNTATQFEEDDDVLKEKTVSTTHKTFESSVKETSTTKEGIESSVSETVESSVSQIVESSVSQTVESSVKEVHSSTTKETTASSVKEFVSSSTTKTVKSSVQKTIESSVIDTESSPSDEVVENVTVTIAKNVESGKMEADCIPYESPNVTPLVQRTVESVDIEQYLEMTADTEKNETDDNGSTGFEPVLMQEIAKSEKSSPDSVIEPMCIIKAAENIESKCTENNLADDLNASERKSISLQESVDEKESMEVSDVDEGIVVEEEEISQATKSPSKKSEGGIFSSIFKKKEKAEVKEEPLEKSESRSIFGIFRGKKKDPETEKNEKTNDSGSSEEKGAKDLKETEKRKRDSRRFSDSSRTSSTSSCSGTSTTISEKLPTEKSDAPPVFQHVPFLYYITPKQFRNKNSVSSSDLEKQAREQFQRHKEKVAAKEASLHYARDRDIQEQRKAGFFSLPRMVDPGKVYSEEEANERRSHFSLPRDTSPNAMKDKEDKSESSFGGFSKFRCFLLRRTRTDSEATDTESSISEIQKDSIDESEMKQKKQKRNFTLKGLNVGKPQSDDKMTPEEEEAMIAKANSTLERSPSYDKAVCHYDYDEDSKKTPTDSRAMRIKQILKNQSITLRNKFGQSEDAKTNRRSFPFWGKRSESPVPMTDSNSAPNLCERHPSINTFIDETPITGSPPPVQAPPLVMEPPIEQSSINPNDSSLDLDKPPEYPPPDIPVEITEDSSSSSEDELECDVGPQARPDWTDSLEKNLRNSLERKLTFSLPSDCSAPQAVPADDVRPVERAIESRQQAPDYLGSMVRCLYLTKCFIANNQVMSATLWAGTNSGNIYVFTVAIPPTDKRKENPITVQIGKEIRLKHAAPVLSITVLDGKSKPFPPPMAVKKEIASAPDTSGPHRVLICSEEQFKVFTLPQLKPYTKYKLTAIDGSRVRKIGFAGFSSSVDPTYKETCFSVVSNQGDASVFSLPDCKKQMDAAIFKREDINGINSTVFSDKGELLFLTSPSEMMRVSLSATKITQPKGAVKPTVVSASITPTKVEKKESEEKDEGEEKKEEKKEEDADDKPASEDKASPAKSLLKEEAPEDPNVTSTSILEMSTTSKKVEEVNGGDTSMLSGDITIDSIRDHIVAGSNTTLASTTTIGSGSNATVQVTSVTSSTTTTGTVSKKITVVKTTTTSSSTNEDDNHDDNTVTTHESSTIVESSAVNGTETEKEPVYRKQKERKKAAPLAKTESFFIKNPRNKGI